MPESKILVVELLVCKTLRTFRKSTQIRCLGYEEQLPSVFGFALVIFEEKSNIYFRPRGQNKNPTLCSDFDPFEHFFLRSSSKLSQVRCCGIL